jgi:hypothetical protein
MTFVGRVYCVVEDEVQCIKSVKSQTLGFETVTLWHCTYVLVSDNFKTFKFEP